MHQSWYASHLVSNICDTLAAAVAAECDSIISDSLVGFIAAQAASALICQRYHMTPKQY